MEGVHESEQSPVYHVDDPDESRAAEVAELTGGKAARMFALVQEWDDDNVQPVRKVVAFGIALPNGAVATVGASGWGFAHWASLDTASRRMCSELVWLGR
jgi:hypothetical protein